jgi:hypothetical protein
MLAVLLAACSGVDAPKGSVAVHADGQEIVIEGDRSLRALVIDLAWDAAGDVTAVQAGADAARLDEVKSKIGADQKSMRVVLTDGRGLRLPRRGTILEVAGGPFRIVRAQGADEDAPGAATLVDVEVK